MKYNEGEYCIFPSYGKGWFDKELDGTRVQMGVECSGPDQYDAGDHVYARSGSDCKLVCKADNGQTYRPKTGSDTFTCSNPIPIQMYSDNCYSSPFKSDGVFHDQCVEDWIEQGLNLVDQTLTYSTAM